MTKRKFLNTIVVSFLIFLTGCNAIKTWWNDLNFTDIANTLSPTIQAASKYGVFAICDNNPDLRPIFIAAGNGVKIAMDAEAFSTEQIKDYIKQALGTENEKWAPVVFSAMDTVLAQYDIIYKKYINASIENNDKLNGFKTILLAMSCGVIEGASMKDLTSIANKTKVQQFSETRRIEANKALIDKVKQL